MIAQMIHLSVWLAVLAAIFVPLERLCAIQRPTGFRRQLPLDLFLYFASGFVPALVLAAPLAALTALAQSHLPEDYCTALDRLPGPGRLTISFAVAEVGFYWGHRWSHEWPWLWRYHALHHEPERLDWLVNSRTHPIDMIFTRLCGLVPIHLLGLASAKWDRGGAIAAAVVALSTWWGFFLHANVRWRFGWLEQLVATPAFHHWHHVADTPLNRNFAATLPALDRFFGTLHLPARDWPERYGIGESPQRDALTEEP